MAPKLKGIIMQFSRRLFIGFFLLAAILLTEKYTDLDLWIQQYFYRSESRDWIINPTLHKQLTFIFYKGLKILLALTAVGCLILLIASLKYLFLHPYRKPAFIMLLSIIFVPLIVASAKYITNVYCPYQLDIFNGSYPFVRILDAYPDWFVQPKPGRCFPAGHATAGFAFMALYYCFQTRRNRLLGLMAGTSLGLIAGTYQMLRGQHFLTHTLFSMVAAFMVIMVINVAISRSFHK